MCNTVDVSNLWSQLVNVVVATTTTIMKMYWVMTSAKLTLVDKVVTTFVCHPGMAVCKNSVAIWLPILCPIKMSTIMEDRIGCTINVVMNLSMVKVMMFVVALAIHCNDIVVV